MKNQHPDNKPYKLRASNICYCFHNCSKSGCDFKHPDWPNGVCVKSLMGDCTSGDKHHGKDHKYVWDLLKGLATKYGCKDRLTGEIYALAKFASKKKDKTAKLNTVGNIPKPLTAKKLAL